MNKYIVNIEGIKANNVAKGFLPELTGQAGSLPFIHLDMLMETLRFPLRLNSMTSPPGERRVRIFGRQNDG